MECVIFTEKKSKKRNEKLVKGHHVLSVSVEDGTLFDDIDGTDDTFVFSKEKKSATECKLRKRSAKKTIYQQTANAQNEDGDGNERHNDNEPQMILLPFLS